MFKLWIDDLRTPPDETWHWAKSVHEAEIQFVQLGGFNEQTGIISLGHDAGNYAIMGGDYIEFLKWLEYKQQIDLLEFSNVTFRLHTMNTVGYLRMKAIIEHNDWNME